MLRTWDDVDHEWREVEVHRDAVTVFCPVCGESCQGVESRPEIVRSNPEAVIDGISNPCPNPLLTEHIVVWTDVVFQPCGHQARQTLR